MATKKYLILNTGAGASPITQESTIDTSAGAGDAGKVPSLDGSGKLDLSFMPSGVGGDGYGILWQRRNYRSYRTYGGRTVLPFGHYSGRYNNDKTKRIG